MSDVKREMNTNKAKKLKALINTIFNEDEKKQIREHFLKRKEQIIDDTANAMQNFTDGLKSGLKQNHKEQK